MTYTVIGNAELYCGDAMEILPTLQAVQCVATDPPYKLTSGGPHGEMSGVFAPENYDNSGSIVDCGIDWSDFMPLLAAVLPRGHAYVMANNRNVRLMLNAAKDAGFEFHNLLVWDKITATPNRWYMKNCEFTGLFYRGKAKLINDCSAKQLIRCPQIDESEHPTEKPVSLFRHYIENSTDRFDVVLDPFLGSGSAGVAAVEAGRRFIGIEKDRKFFDMACERIATAGKQIDLFAAE